jgi:hypothetical protein
VLDVLQVQLLALDKGQQTAGGADDDVGAVRFQDLLVLRDGKTTKKHADL